MKLLSFFRPFISIARELRRLNDNIEWLMLSHPYLRDTGLPPTAEEIKEAEKERFEVSSGYDEEEHARQAAIELYRRRAQGERINPDEPGAGFDIYG